MQQAPGQDAQDDGQVLTRVRGRLGHILLNRPRALNALTHGMVVRIAKALDEWANDDAVACVLISGAGERGLCAGGDITALYHDRAEGAASAAFWRDEYRLNARLARYPKPVTAFMDGIVLGGGVGISAHAGHRIVTERSRVGMPETGIGFVPDVGGTWLLARAPGELGTYAALTGGQFGAPDAILLGLADICAASADLPAIAAKLEDTDPRTVLSQAARPAPDAPLAAQRAWIDRCFSADTVEEILARLRARPEPEAAAAAAELGAGSPTALKVTLAALRRARRLPDLEAALSQEYRVSLHALRTPDFAEGVRARVIDKDRRPQWSPAEPGQVPDAAVEAYFAPAPHGDLFAAPAENGNA